MFGQHTLTEGRTQQEEQELEEKDTLEEMSPKPSNLRIWE